MTSPFTRLRRSMIAIAALPILAGLFVPAPAAAATRLFIVANELAEIWELNPADGTKLSGFALIPPVAATRPGLAFDGTFLYYTAENLATVTVYTLAGAVDRTLPKPVGTEPGSGLGVSKTSLFMVALDGVITLIDKTTGAVQSSFTIPGAASGLTFAGSRNSLFVEVNDSGTVREISTAGVAINTISVSDIFRGLAFSSSNNTLYGTRAGVLWAVNPNTGANLPGFPVQIEDLFTGTKLLKSGAAAADEPVLEFCGDEILQSGAGETCDPPGAVQTNGAACRQDCTYCGDAVTQTNEQCDDGNTNDNDACSNSCQIRTCGNNNLDPGESCDPPGSVLNNGQTCRQDCTYCGDNIVQPQGGEQCELPNTTGCDANCHATELCTDLIDNDGDGQIDCTDPDCDCLPIGRDPGAIRFGRPGSGDLFAVHGALKPLTAFDLTTDTIAFLLTNANGEVFKLVIPAGDVKQIGKNLWRFKNQLAQRNRSGLARFDLRYFPRRDNFTFVVKTYGDLSKATLAKMGVQLVIGEDLFFNESTWSKLPKGWLLSLPGE